MTTLAMDSLARLDVLAVDERIELVREAPLAPFTTLRVGGPADRLATPRDATQLVACLGMAAAAGVPAFVLGNGSDVVVADAGIRGLVIRNRARVVTIDGMTLTADSGAAMAMLVRRCTDAALGGLEFGISIPGTLGGAVWANAGAHGGEIKDVVRHVTVHDPARGASHRLDASQCGFAYRESRFKSSGEIVLTASLELTPGNTEEIAARVDQHLAARRASQPLADQNAGSVFRNPNGDHAGRLIEAAGLKGARVGTARVSEKHANFIVTDPRGRAADVRALGDRVRRMVLERFGVELAYEIEFVGDWGADAAGPARGPA
ncbi:MAG: UDP-N-acetylmuramate dehydrogenase [Candidatus Limnocylindria bacterium]